MNITPARAGLTPQQWDRDFFMEYVRESQFARYFGTTENSLIQVKDDLTRKPGDTVTFAAVRKLVGAGVTGNTILEGNEEILDNRSLKLLVNPIRHAVAVSDWDEQKSAIDLRNAARTALKIWMMEKMRNDIITAMQSMDGTPFATAGATAQNAWLSDNSDRVLFGNARANASSGVMATALGTVTTGYTAVTGGALSASAVSLAKRIAKNAHPGIRPIKIKNGNEYFVMFANSYSFRDLVNDPVIVNSRSQALPRSPDNPLFQDGDVMWDGVIVREVPELTVLSTVGSGGINVGMNLLCGAQALGVAWAQRTKTRENVRDYGFMHGVGIQEIRGIGKLRFGTDPNTDTSTPKDNGIVTVFSSAAADA
jgi:N4-gp56 family major capsid protein